MIRGKYFRNSPPTFRQEEKGALRTEGATLSDGGKFGGGGSRPGPRDRIPRTCMTPRRRARKRRAREDPVAKKGVSDLDTRR